MQLVFEIKFREKLRYLHQVQVKSYFPDCRQLRQVLHLLYQFLVPDSTVSHPG